MEGAIALEGPPAATWATSSPEHRGALFAMGCKLWDQRGEVLRDDAIADAQRRVAVARMEAGAARGFDEAERGRLRADADAREGAWSKRLMEAHREIGELRASLGAAEAERRGDADKHMRAAFASTQEAVAEAVERVTDELRTARAIAVRTEVEHAETMRAARAVAAQAEAEVKTAIAKASPMTSMAVVLAVGARLNGQASLGTRTLSTRSL